MILTADLLMVEAIRQKLFLVFLEHSLRTFQDGFRGNPDCALCEIQTMAAEGRPRRSRRESLFSWNSICREWRA